MADTDTQSVVFSLEKIYLKDVSYEAPGAPQVFLDPKAPQVQIELGIAHSPLNEQDGIYEVVLGLTVTAKREDKPIFLVEIKQAGLFQIKGIERDPLTRTLEISCPHVLLPYAREAIDALVGKGGFPQLLINPVNFEALFEQKRAAQQQQAQQ